ncbi:MAG: hypothetical protein NTZ78_02965 [Candidatus Aureabacteria bacterium]|nr:hypothetical protein [Candidatus Auribacterota bacterium]
MSAHEAKGLGEIDVNLNNLYHEESFTDMKVASVRRLTPIRPDGTPDAGRTPIFIGQAHVMTAAGTIPVSCPIEARTIEEAMQKFPEAVKKGVEKMVAELKEIQREEASRIILPGEGPGNIQLR